MNRDLSSLLSLQRINMIRAPFWIVVLGDAAHLANVLREEPGRVNAKNGYGDTLLHQAIHYDRPECIDVLLAAGTDQRICDPLGRTPMYLAASKNLVVVVQKLYLHPTGGPGVANLQNKSGHTTLSVAQHHVRAFLDTEMQRARERAAAMAAFLPAHLGDDLAALVVSFADRDLECPRNYYGPTAR